MKLTKVIKYEQAHYNIHKQTNYMLLCIIDKEKDLL